MKGSERVQKFNEFKKLHQTGQLRSSEIVSKLGISINTLYNWRRIIRTEVTGNKPTPILKPAALPIFIKIIPQTATSKQSISPFIEIVVGASMVIRIPETLQPESLLKILDAVARWNC
jgi:transposase-like protein